jgi:hypothetical protein
MKEVPGLANAKNAKPPNPKPSPKDFVWPSQKNMDDKIAQKIAASLQELLPARGWKHTDLAKALYGTAGANEAPRNVAAPRRWVVAEHPIPNETAAGYIAQILDVPMSRLLEPEGKFQAFPPMIRGRSDSKRFPFKGTPKTRPTKAKTPGGRDVEKQRAYNAAYRARKKAERKGEPSYYMRKKLEKLKSKHAKSNGNGAVEDDGSWVLAEGIAPPDYKISSASKHPGHVAFELKATIPHARAMAILHMLQHEAPEE